MRSLILTIGLAMAGSAMAQSSLPRFPRQTPYADARQSLIGLGWQPITLPEADECRDDRCDGRPEMLACSGTGVGYCSFTWRRRETIIEVVTRGENIPVVTAVRCRVGCR